MKKALSFLFCMLMIVMTAMPAFADESKVINEVRLTVAEAVAGEAINKTIESAEPDKYTAKSRYWIRLPSDNDPEVFEAGYVYRLVFDVTPAAGYTFAAVEKNGSGFDESPTVVYVNGQKTFCVSAETNKNLGRAYDATIAAEEEKPVSFFQRFINSIRDFFKKIADFFKRLFGIK